MSSLKAFLKQNKRTTGTAKFAASRSFTDEEGNPVEWEVRPLKSREADDIRAQCTSISGKKTIVDSAKFNRMAAAKCTVFPNLNDSELQDSYGVLGAEELIQELLDNDGEYQMYCRKVLELSGYDKTNMELIEEAKNS